MRNNYDIKINPKRPSSEDISRRRDFDALLARHRQAAAPPPRAARRRLLYTAVAAAAAVAGLLIYFGWWQAPGESPASMRAEEYFARQPFVNPPLETITPRFATQRVDAGAGGAFEFTGGSRLVVPTQAFLDDRGRLVEGEVDIHYREMHDYVDFFIAGIPMVYDSAGQRYYLESAGMIEIFALQNGRRVDLAPGKSIEVELVSEITLPNVNVSPRYNIYRLDTANRRWVYQDVDHIQFLGGEELDENDPLYAERVRLLEQLQRLEAQTEARLAQIERIVPLPPAPVKPQRQEKGRLSLELDLSAAARQSAGAEQPLYEGTVWQISPRSPAFDADALRDVWEDVRLQALNNLEYELTLLSGERSLRLIVQPVLSGDDFDRAVQRYEEALSDYQDRLRERDRQLNAERENVLAEAAGEKTAAQRAFEAAVASRQQQGLAVEDAGIRRRIVNRFYATSFGIWNCDRPIPLSGQTVRAELVDQHGNEYDNHTAYLVRRDQNTVYRFYAGNHALMQLSDDAESILWLVARDNKIAVLRPGQLRQVNRKKGEQTLRLELLDEVVRSEEDLRRILEF